MSSPVLGLELADAEKGCSSGEGHLSVLRRIAEKLSSDSLAKNAKDALNVLFGKCNCRIHRTLEASAWKLYEGDWKKLLSMHMFFWCFFVYHGYPLNKLDWDTLKRIQRQQFQNRRVLNHSGDPFLRSRRQRKATPRHLLWLSLSVSFAEALGNFQGDNLPSSYTWNCAECLIISLIGNVSQMTAKYPTPCELECSECRLQLSWELQQNISYMTRRHPAFVHSQTLAIGNTHAHTHIYII